MPPRGPNWKNLTKEEKCQRILNTTHYKRIMEREEDRPLATKSSRKKRKESTGGSLEALVAARGTGPEPEPLPALTKKKRSKKPVKDDWEGSGGLETLKELVASRDQLDMKHGEPDIPVEAAIDLLAENASVDVEPDPIAPKPVKKKRVFNRKKNVLSSMASPVSAFREVLPRRIAVEDEKDAEVPPVDVDANDAIQAQEIASVELTDSDAEYDSEDERADIANKSTQTSYEQALLAQRRAMGTLF